MISPGAQKRIASKKKTNYLTPTQALAVRREVAKQMSSKADYKHALNTRSTSATIDYSGTTYDLLENLARGDNPVNGFLGSKITPKSIRIRGSVHIADSYNVFRIMVIQWKDSGAPVPSGIINNTGTISAPYGSRYWTNKKNIKVLADRLIILDGVQASVQTVDIYVGPQKLTDIWFQTASNTAQSGGLYMLAISDSSTSAHPFFTWVSEVVFTDS